MKTPRHPLVFAATSALLLGAFVTSAQAALHRVGSPDVRFEASGSMGMRIVGTSHALDVGDDGTTLTVTVPLARVGTGIDLRDEHMRNYLDVAHHPDAVLSVPRAALSFPSGAATSGDAQGTMTLHGRSHDVRFHYRARPTGSGVRVDATTTIDMGHYGIEVPSYLGIEVARRVSVAVVFEVRDP